MGNLAERRGRKATDPPQGRIAGPPMTLNQQGSKSARSCRLSPTVQAAFRCHQREGTRMLRSETRQAMIMRHMPLVAFVVGRMSADNQKTLGLDREDALAYGIDGLIQAVDAFDETRGTSFASFAVRRIRGSILDAIRKMDPLPRSLRKSTREVEQASQELAANLGRWPTPKEIAFRMGMPLEQLDAIMRHSGSKFISLEHALQDRVGDTTPAFDPVDE